MSSARMHGGGPGGGGLGVVDVELGGELLTVLVVVGVVYVGLGPGG